MKLSIITRVSVFLLSLISLVESFASVDWRSLLPPVKNQGSCNFSYAYAALAPLEAALARKGRRVNLSEQEVVDCTRNYRNNGCNGGWVTGVYDYIQRTGGVSFESAYNYRGVVQTCRPDSNRNGRIIGYVNVNNQAAMEDALTRVGPVAIALQAGIPSFQMYRGGIYNDPACGAGSPDHWVTLVGLGVENGIPYYLLRNSWGTG